MVLNTFITDAQNLFGVREDNIGDNRKIAIRGMEALGKLGSPEAVRKLLVIARGEENPWLEALASQDDHRRSDAQQCVAAARRVIGERKLVIFGVDQLHIIPANHRDVDAMLSPSYSLGELGVFEDHYEEFPERYPLISALGVVQRGAINDNIRPADILWRPIVGTNLHGIGEIIRALAPHPSVEGVHLRLAQTLSGEKPEVMLLAFPIAPAAPSESAGAEEAKEPTDSGHRETSYLLDLNAAARLDPADLPAVQRIFVEPGAEVPALWQEAEQIPLSADPEAAQKLLAEKAAKGEIVLIAPDSQLSTESWGGLLREYGLLGIRMTPQVVSTIGQLTPIELEALLASLGPQGGFILGAEIESRTPGERNLRVFA